MVGESNKPLNDVPSLDKVAEIRAGGDGSASAPITLTTNPVENCNEYERESGPNEPAETRINPVSPVQTADKADRITKGPLEVKVRTAGVRAHTFPFDALKTFKDIDTLFEGRKSTDTVTKPNVEDPRRTDLEEMDTEIFLQHAVANEVLEARTASRDIADPEGLCVRKYKSHTEDGAKEGRKKVEELVLEPDI